MFLLIVDLGDDANCLGPEVLAMRALGIEGTKMPAMSTLGSTAAWVYVRRSALGALAAVSREVLPGHDERMAVDDPEVVAWMQQFTPRKAALLESDLALIRALEDLIDVLIRKDILLLTDLPESVQAKLMTRRHLRGSLQSLSLLDNEQDTV